LHNRRRIEVDANRLSNTNVTVNLNTWLRTINLERRLRNTNTNGLRSLEINTDRLRDPDVTINL
jgi:hypothetical protein